MEILEDLFMFEYVVQFMQENAKEVKKITEEAVKENNADYDQAYRAALKKLELIAVSKATDAFEKSSNNVPKR